MLSVLLIAPLTARAGHLAFADVAQTVVDVQGGRPRVELRLRYLSQSGRAATVSGATQQQQGGAQSSGTTQGTTQTQSGGAASTVTGVEPAQGGTGGQVQVVDLGEVTGTVCDCPLPPPPPGGDGFPLWPLFGLGGIPLFFLGGDEEPPGQVFPTPTPTTTPTPPNPIPEPATLLLLGSSLLALGAGARRRRSRKELDKGIVVAEEG